MNTRSYLPEKYVCDETGFDYDIWRPKGKKREKGHLKMLYCPICDLEHNFTKKEEQCQN